MIWFFFKIKKNAFTKWLFGDAPFSSIKGKNGYWKRWQKWNDSGNVHDLMAFFLTLIVYVLPLKTMRHWIEEQDYIILLFLQKTVSHYYYVIYFMWEQDYCRPGGGVTSPCLAFWGSTGGYSSECSCLLLPPSRVVNDVCFWVGLTFLVQPWKEIDAAVTGQEKVSDLHI